MRKYKQRLTFSLFVFSMLYGTTMADDDGPPCDAGWERYKDEKCFKIFNDTLENEEKAKMICNEKNGTLITIGTNEEQEFLFNFLFKTNKVVDTIWLGAKKDSKYNKFKWADGSNMFFLNWFDPLKHLNSKDDDICVEMLPELNSRGKWTNEPCNKRNLVVCQKIQFYRCDILRKKFFDTRKLLDYITLFSGNFSHFKIYPDKSNGLQVFIFPSLQTASSWDNAKTLCEKYFASLVEIESDVKQMTVQSFLNQIPPSEASALWLGGYKVTDGKFKWSSNEIDVSYTNWYPELPIGNGTHIKIWNNNDSYRGKWFLGTEPENNWAMCEISFSFDYTNN